MVLRVIQSPLLWLVPMVTPRQPHWRTARSISRTALWTSRSEATAKGINRSGKARHILPMASLISCRSPKLPPHQALPGSRGLSQDLPVNAVFLHEADPFFRIRAFRFEVLLQGHEVFLGSEPLFHFLQDDVTRKINDHRQTSSYPQHAQGENDIDRSGGTVLPAGATMPALLRIPDVGAS